MPAFTAAELEALIPRLRRFARALTGSREAADDLTQDTLERAWAKRELWQAGTNLRAWLFAVMHSVFVNGTRRWRPIESLDALPGAAFERPDHGASVETAIVVRELREALLGLPDEQRQVVLLVGLEEFSYAEAAEVLGVPIGTVMSRLSRGRERLRQLLEEGSADRHGLRRVK
ncbi:MAG: RNA polymerase sigma factor [Burkholderiales bacterium]|nr:MAG: RNA polymerase sigma factor [Burkholderiales bacterium]